MCGVRVWCVRVHEHCVCMRSTSPYLSSPNPVPVLVGVVNAPLIIVLHSQSVCCGMSLILALMLLTRLVLRRCAREGSGGGETV